MAGADEATVSLVGAVAGLLAQVAHADLQLEATEVDAIRTQLGRVGGLSPAGVRAIVDLVTGHAGELSQEGIHPYARVLAERGTREMRLEVLDVLMDVAAADGTVSMEETNLLRRVTTAMHLEDTDYLTAQARYRERLSVLDPTTR